MTILKNDRFSYKVERVNEIREVFEVMRVTPTQASDGIIYIPYYDKRQEITFAEAKTYEKLTVDDSRLR